MAFHGICNHIQQSHSGCLAKGRGSQLWLALMAFVRAIPQIYDLAQEGCTSGCLRFSFVAK